MSCIGSSLSFWCFWVWRELCALSAEGNSLGDLGLLCYRLSGSGTSFEDLVSMSGEGPFVLGIGDIGEPRAFSDAQSKRAILRLERPPLRVTGKLSIAVEKPSSRHWGTPHDVEKTFILGVKGAPFEVFPLESIELVGHKVHGKPFSKGSQDRACWDALHKRECHAKRQKLTSMLYLRLPRLKI